MITSNRFQVEYGQPYWKCYIDFQMYKEGQEETWNGYYREYRIRLRMTELTWIVTVYENGVMVGAFINRKTECSQEDINRLIQVGCFLIDQLEKWRE